MENLSLDSVRSQLLIALAVFLIGLVRHVLPELVRLITRPDKRVKGERRRLLLHLLILILISVFSLILLLELSILADRVPGLRSLPIVSEKG